MRITKVALAFFSIGFLAGSFERAAGLADAERPKRIADRQVDTAVARGTKMVLASVGFIGGGLPEELRMPPAAAVPPVVEGLGAALSGFDAEPAAKREGPSSLTTVAPLNPDFRHRGLLAKRRLSEPDALAISRMPEQRWMSLPSIEPWDFGPKQDAGGARGGSQEMAVQEFIMPFERGKSQQRLQSGAPASSDRFRGGPGFACACDDPPAAGGVRRLARRVWQRRDCPRRSRPDSISTAICRALSPGSARCWIRGRCWAGSAARATRPDRTSTMRCAAGRAGMSIR